MHQHAQRALEAVDDCLPRCRSHDDVGLLCQRPCRVGHVRGTGSPDMHLDGRLVVPVVADHVDALSRADFQAAQARKGIAARGAQHQFLDAGIPLLAAGRPATMACQRHCNHTRQADGSASLHGIYNTADTVPPDCPHAPGASLPSLVIQGLLHEKNRPAHAYVRPPRRSSRGVDAGGATGGQPSAQFDLCIVSMCAALLQAAFGGLRGGLSDHPRRQRTLQHVVPTRAPCYWKRTWALAGCLGAMDGKGPPLRGTAATHCRWDVARSDKPPRYTRPAWKSHDRRGWCIARLFSVLRYAECVTRCGGTLRQALR